MAFLHHLAAFTVVGALAAEVVLFKPPLTVVQARRLQRADQVFGAAAAVLLVVGLLRVVQVPVITPQAATRARMCMMLELTAILGILLCAPFMARGIGLLR